MDPTESLKVGTQIIMLAGVYEGLCGKVFDLVHVGSRSEYAVALENGQYVLVQGAELARLEPPERSR
jgi:hypothetical protein